MIKKHDNNDRQATIKTRKGHIREEKTLLSLSEKEKSKGIKENHDGMIHDHHSLNDTVFYGWVILICSYLLLFASLYSAILSKLLPSSSHPVWIKFNRYHYYLFNLFISIVAYCN